MITGGTGSFGNKILQYLLKNTDITEIRIFSRDEEKQDRMRNEIIDNRVKYYIGDVRDYASIDKAVIGIDFVFHAAALKQVPSCEFFPMEAIKTNILGTENLLESSIRNKVKKVIVLSTDKAVNPINAMGMTKALMEKIMIAKSRYKSNTVLCATRYGNVMGSRGSVIPLFIKQIKEGKDITITDPNMTRFMMSLEESVKLVLYAYKYSKTGDIFVQKAPSSTILNLAKALQYIFKANNKIKIIGYRQGEKKHETLINQEEMSRAQNQGEYYRIPSNVSELNYSIHSKIKDYNFHPYNNKEYNSYNTKRLNIEQMINKLSKLDYIKQNLKK